MRLYYNEEQNYTKINKLTTKLIMLFPLLMVLMPRPNIPGIHLLTYPAMAAILILTIFAFLKINIPKGLFTLIWLLFAYSIAISLSLLFNSGDVSTSDIVVIFKPIFFIIILLFGYLATKNAPYHQIKKALLRSAYIILFFQIIVGIPQVFEISIFSFIYNDVKSNGLGSILRIAGTLSNPNFFAWIVIQMAVVIYLFEEKAVKKTLWLVICGILVLLSGSRSSLLLLPIILFVLNLLKSKKNNKFYFIKLPIYFSLLALSFLAVYMFLIRYGMHFPYLNQILLIIEGGSLSSVNSFNMRTIMWADAFQLMEEQKGLITTLFGLGPGTVSALDNDYYYAFVNFGLIALCLNLVIYLIIVFIFLRVKSREFRALGLQYVAFSLIIGLQADTLSGWNYPLLILFFTGIAVTLLNRTPEELQQTIHRKKKRKRRIVWSK